ncbi:MAG: hypothetical protein V1775_18235 [Bacteroidota bacterium]
MKKTDTIWYDFDPDILYLRVKVNGSNFGGFSGAHAEREFSRLLGTGADINITDMSNSVKNARVRRLRAIWNKLGIDQYREAILEPYGVTSTADLNLDQLDELITRYSAESNKPANELIRTLRSDVLAQLNRLGIYTNNGDWTAVNNFLMSEKIAGKVLYNLNEEQLRVLRKKLHSIITKKQATEAEDARKQLLN